MSMTPRTLRTVLVASLSTLVLGATVAIPALATDYGSQRDETERRQQANERAMEELQADLEDTDAELLAAQAALDGILARIPVAQAELAAAEQLLEQLQREAAIIADRLEVAEGEETLITGQIAGDEERAGLIKNSIGQMARDAYKGDMATSSLAAVLDSQSTDEFVEQTALASTALRTQTRALRDLEQINGVNRNRQARLAAVRDQIVGLKAEADAKVVEAQAARAEAEARTVELEELREQQQLRTRQIESQRADQLARQAQLEQQQAALADELAAIIRKQDEERRRQAEAAAAAAKAAAEQAAREAAAAGRPAPPAPAPAPGLPPAQNPGRVLAYPSPMNPPVITSHYGWRVHPVYGYRKLHAGTDFRAYCGTEIIASAAGTVEWAYYRGGFGNQVMLNHGYHNGSSLMTSYNHLSRFAVSAGQQVSKGQVVGYSGTTGTSTACHLHFEVYINGATQNPMNYL
ncbi:M23 family metallopeptidase [Actinotalea sp. K2]|uniref:M23 family metallopeptidase n=1 Tax=Actinotalea sp. K2 TaxID=2939438 RepID=UPI002017569E|nr:M23 family metallopeptidase [Actinotalea sp. K2]MCL3862541.1 M23 family metallopeptidase [Actinotalea sp. K2]